MPSHVRTSSALLALAVAALLCSAASAASTKSSSGSKSGSSKKSKHHRVVIPPSEVTLSSALTKTPGASVTMPPVGLSIEYSVMASALGAGACPPPALVATLRELGSPPISLAGQSQDMTAPPGAPTSGDANWESATTYSLPAQFWSQMHCLLSSSPDPITVGLDARAGQLSWAQQMVGEAHGAAGASGLSFSIGNEPDLYYLPNYASLDKAQANAETVDVDTYLSVASYLAQALGGAPLVGPELARPEHWRGSLPRVIDTMHEQTVGVHMYPLSACDSPRAVTLGGLLSTSVAEAPSRMAWVVADAVAADAPAIISEANSASCGGVSGVSDSDASAVWGVRFVLSALKTGFREVRFHLSGDPYDPFVVEGSTVIARPLQSALVALNQWLPAGSTLRSVSGVRELVATAIGQPSGGSLLVLDNESGKPRPIVLRGASSAHLQLFSATHSGAQVVVLNASHGRISTTLAPNTVACISWTS